MRVQLRGFRLRASWAQERRVRRRGLFGGFRAWDVSSPSGKRPLALYSPRDAGERARSLRKLAPTGRVRRWLEFSTAFADRRADGRNSAAPENGTGSLRRFEQNVRRAQDDGTAESRPAAK